MMNITTTVINRGSNSASRKRMLEMMDASLPTPGGFPAVGEQAVLDRYIEGLEDDEDYFSAYNPDY